MNTATFAIPNRWEKGLNHIKSWIENYARVVGQPFEASTGGEIDSGQIWITDPGTLTADQYTAADNAIDILNNRLNKPKGEPWKARADAEFELEKQLSEIENLFYR